MTSQDPASREVASLLGDLATAERAATEAVVVATNDLATALEGVVGDVAASDTFAADGAAGMVR